MEPPLAAHRDAPLNHRGYCECSWAGRRRLLRSSAVLDVLEHCALTGHEPVFAGASLSERNTPPLLV